jgi:hypothetical protein
MLGYSAAVQALAVGRAGFYGPGERGLPKKKDDTVRADDLVPQFGFVGARYRTRRVLLMGIHPGEGPEVRSVGDERMIPRLQAFAEAPSVDSYAAACEAHRQECTDWSIWKKHCGKFVRPGKLAIDEIAFTNCVPWRARNKWEVPLDVIDASAKSYVSLYLEELDPILIVAFGRFVPKVLDRMARRPWGVIHWNMDRNRSLVESAHREALGKFDAWLDTHPPTV